MEEQRKRDAMAARVYAPAAGVNIDLTQGEKDTLARIDNAKAAGVRLNQFWLDWEAARRSPAATADVSELADAAEAVLLPEIASLEAGIHRKNEEIAELRRLVEGLKSALKPFVSVSDQPTSQMAKVIHKGVSGLAPVALTVTKDQFKAAMSALSSTKDTQP